MKPFVIVALLVVPVLSVAQKTDFEFLAGPNLSSLRGNNILDEYHKARVGISTGIGLSRYVSRRFAVAMKFLYESKGSKGNIPLFYQETIDGTEVNSYFVDAIFNLRNTYLSLPVTVKYIVGEKVKFSGEMGGNVSYLITTSTQFKSPIGPPTYGVPTLSDYKKIDLGVVLAVGALYSFNESVSISVTLRDTLGFSDISDVALANGAIRTNSIALTFGLSYRLNYSSFGPKIRHKHLPAFGTV